MQRLLAALGAPHRRVPPVVHVAGTNGKGSLVAYLRAMVEAAGKRAHVYTSPHLVRFNERIVIAGQTIDDPALARVIGLLTHRLPEPVEASLPALPGPAAAPGGATGAP